MKTRQYTYTIRPHELDRSLKKRLSETYLLIQKPGQVLSEQEEAILLKTLLNDVNRGLNLFELQIKEETIRTQTDDTQIKDAILTKIGQVNFDRLIKSYNQFLLDLTGFMLIYHFYSIMKDGSYSFCNEQNNQSNTAMSYKNNAVYFDATNISTTYHLTDKNNKKQTYTLDRVHIVFQLTKTGFAIEKIETNSALIRDFYTHTDSITVKRLLNPNPPFYKKWQFWAGTIGVLAGVALMATGLGAIPGVLIATTAASNVLGLTVAATGWLTFGIGAAAVVSIGIAAAKQLYHGSPIPPSAHHALLTHSEASSKQRVTPQPVSTTASSHQKIHETFTPPVSPAVKSISDEMQKKVNHTPPILCPTSETKKEENAAESCFCTLRC